MHITIRKKILGIILVLTLIAILSTSGVYYYFLVRDIRELSQKQIRIAFEMLFDDLIAQTKRIVSGVENFIRERLLVNMTVLSNSFKQLDSLKTQDSRYLSQLQSLMPIASSMIAEIGKFIPLLEINEFLVYDAEQKLLAVYRHIGNENVLGLYLPQLYEGTFISLRTPEEVSAMWGWQNIQDIPKHALPDNIAAFYTREVPKTTLATISTLGKVVTLKLTVPILREEQLQGICVFHVGIRELDIRRYARFSQTAVNIFAGTALSVGTLADYTTIALNDSAAFARIDVLALPAVLPIQFSKLPIGPQEYYQGRIIFGDDLTSLGAITANFPRQIEKTKRNHLLLFIGGVTVVVGLLTVFTSSIFSSRIVRPITTMTHLIYQITQGNLTGLLQAQDSQKKLTESRWKRADELTILSRSFAEMVAYLHEMATVANSIAQGDISRTMTPRSEHDMLGLAFYRMSEYLREVAAIGTAIADGDLRQEFQPKSADDVLGTAFHKMKSLRQAISQILTRSEQVRTASDDLKQISAQMTGDTEQAYHKVHVVSEASQQITQRVNDVATAIEEFSASIREISRNTSEVSDIANTAVNLTDSTSTTITALETQSQEIGNITQVIATITQQTNLLALNATIEAARAGEAGRGFAVVANEVKSLAQEVALAAEDISHKITGIQSGSKKAVTAISEVSAIIAKVNEISGTIATSLEQQAATTHQISNSVHEAATGSSEVAGAITEVSAVVQNTSDRATQVQQASQELTSLADQLQQLVEKFKI